MTELEQGELRVVVPVGFLLDAEQEVSVAVPRPDGRSLPIRIRLVPARVAACGGTSVSEPTPLVLGWPVERLATAHIEDGYPAPDYGGGD
jgi:hypothetical protein